MPHAYVRAWTLFCFHSPISTQTFRSALTASADRCENKRVPFQWRNQFCHNQHTRELISARNMQHKHNYKDLKYVTQTQQQRPESPAVTLTWHACKHKVHKVHQKYIPKCDNAVIVWRKVPESDVQNHCSSFSAN